MSGPTAAAAIYCWSCGAIVDAGLLPLRREEVCPACNADLHVCRQCRFYNPRISDACDEPLAGGVRNKERANFCDYLRLVPGRAGGRADDDATLRARAALDALFGDGPAPEADTAAASRELRNLFGLDDN